MASKSISKAKTSDRGNGDNEQYSELEFLPTPLVEAASYSDAFNNALETVASMFPEAAGLIALEKSIHHEIDNAIRQFSGTKSAVSLMLSMSLVHFKAIEGGSARHEVLEIAVSSLGTSSDNSIRKEIEIRDTEAGVNGMLGLFLTILGLIFGGGWIDQVMSNPISLLLIGFGGALIASSLVGRAVNFLIRRNNGWL